MPHEDIIRHRADTYTYSDFSAASTSKNIAMFTLPSTKCEIIGQFIHVTVAFAGPATIEAMTGTPSGSYKEYLVDQSVKTTGVKSAKGSEPALRFLIPASGGPVYVRMEASANLNTLTNGSLTVYTAYIYHDY